MKIKKAVITLELVDESLLDKNESIIQELIDWFHEDLCLIPWVKEVKEVVIREE